MTTLGFRISGFKRHYNYNNFVIEEISPKESKKQKFPKKNVSDKNAVSPKYKKFV